MSITILSKTIERLFAAKDEKARIRILSELSTHELDEIIIYLNWRANRPRRPRGLRVPGGMAVHHLDGNPHNNDPANLRVVATTENRE